MKKIVAGNWKMNKTSAEATSLVQALDQFHSPDQKLDVLLFPPSLYLQTLNAELKIDSALHLGAQNCSEHLSGAYTGEISLLMLQSIGIQWILIGHSERRIYYGENKDVVAQKVKTALNQNINYILCIGETLTEREQGQFEEIIKQQLNSAFQNPAEINRVYLAYEPVWAIGTGKTASLTEIEQAHTFIKNYCKTQFKWLPEQVHVLYGGSCNEKNALEILSTKHVDGVLVGGASLQFDSFKTIIQAARSCINN